MDDSGRVSTTDDYQKQRLREGSVRKKRAVSKKVGIVNLGCARNLVDSQEILGRVRKGGHPIVDVEDADIAIVNTCGFIAEAKQESIDTILELLELKQQGSLERVIVAGCLAQRYGRELAQELPGIDAIVGTPKFGGTGVRNQVYLTPAHYAYVKICESCYNRCSFCAIPGIKGKFSSRRIESVVEEIARLDARGVREINLIGQDITAYGIDLYQTYSLARLLKAIIPVTTNIRWIRLLYAFPSHVTDELIDVMATEEKICNYIDMPLQHINDTMLQAMNRNITTQQTKDLVTHIRRKMPQGSLRTTFIVGFPGETEAYFAEMLQFVKDVSFEKVGVFIYSPEEGTPAFDLKPRIPAPVKRQRLRRLMTVQQGISAYRQQQYVGCTLPVLIDEAATDAPDVYIGRTEYDAPEVDGVVYVHTSRVLKPGNFVNVRITDAMEYDLAGECV